MKMAHVASENKLASYEIPSALLIVSEAFTEQNGTLTASFKVRRNQIFEKYAAQIKSLDKNEVLGFGLFVFCCCLFLSFALFVVLFV
jgi:long-subunit acyl-CoA synthetase (AMP-forming)